MNVSSHQPNFVVDGSASISLVGLGSGVAVDWAAAVDVGVAGTAVGVGTTEIEQLVKFAEPHVGGTVFQELLVLRFHSKIPFVHAYTMTRERIPTNINISKKSRLPSSLMRL